MAEGGFVRHTLAYVTPEAWSVMMVGEDDALLRGWAEAGRPAIIRRPDCSDRSDMVPLGIPLPPMQGKRRVALRCPLDAIVRMAPPPPLCDAAQAAPDAWQISIARLLMLAPDVACFGSLAWAHLTGLPYLADNSDIDLIFGCASSDCADRIAQGLEVAAVDAPMRVDAELVTPLGEAVQWREWASGSVELLAKSMAGTRLSNRKAIFA